MKSVSNVASALPARMGAASSDWADVPVIQPDELFRGVLLVTVPHMDDEALACAGAIAKLSDKSRVHLLYATDGMESPEPVLPWRDSVSPDLGAIRRSESVSAMAVLGVPASNLHFLNLPERRLEQHEERLHRLTSDLIGTIRPNHILTPFRFDRHRDHIALNRVVTAATRLLDDVQLYEYFVYHRWRLLPKKDVRRYLDPRNLVRVEIGDVAAQKRAALECFTSQTTCFYSWQARPNLTSTLLDDVCREPELFLPFKSSMPGASVLTGSVRWIRIAHRLESPLKRMKDKAVAFGRRALAGSGAKR